MPVIDITKLDDHGIRMLQVVNWVVIEGVHPPDLGKFFDKPSPRGYPGSFRGGLEFGGTAERWNVAEGFIHSWWDNGGNITPYGPGYNFADIVSEKMNARYDESWDFQVYDKEGRELDLKISVVATTKPGPTFAEVLEQDRKHKEREKIDAAKKAEAKEQAKAEREKLKAAALDKLSPAERKALGI